MLITALSLILNIQYSKHHQFKNNRSTICFILHHCPSLRFFNNSASFNPFSRITLIFNPNSVILKYRFPYFESNFLSISKPNHGLTNGCSTAFLSGSIGSIIPSLNSGIHDGSSRGYSNGSLFFVSASTMFQLI